MTATTRPIARLAVLACLALPLAAPATETAERLSGTFVLSVGGLKAATIAVDGGIAGGGYAMTVDLGTDGVVGAFYEAGLEAQVEGAVEGDRLMPALFRSRYSDAEKSRRVEMRYEGGAPAVTAEPAFDPKPWQLDPAEQVGLLDPLSALLTAFAPKPRTELCDRTYRIFDARRLYAIELAPASRPSEGGVITCEALYRRLAGFKQKQLDEPPFPFRVQFERRADGLWEVDRAIGATPVGTAVLARANRD